MAVFPATGIYLVQTNGGRRAVVLADNARQAAEKVSGMLRAEAGVSSGDFFNPSSYEVGRLGTYDPGATGAALVALSQRVDIADGSKIFGQSDD